MGLVSFQTRAWRRSRNPAPTWAAVQFLEHKRSLPPGAFALAVPAARNALPGSSRGPLFGQLSAIRRHLPREALPSLTRGQTLFVLSFSARLNDLESLGLLTPGRAFVSVSTPWNAEGPLSCSAGPVTVPTGRQRAHRDR